MDRIFTKIDDGEAERKTNSQIHTYIHIYMCIYIDIYIYIYIYRERERERETDLRAQSRRYEAVLETAPRMNSMEWII